MGSSRTEADRAGDEAVRAFDEGRLALETEGWVLVRVAGADAERWLQDIVTADVVSLGPGDVVRSLLLGPTGRIRADFWIARIDDGLLLLQTPDQPRGIDEILDPYVLSSDVTLERAQRGPALVRAKEAWAIAPPDAPGSSLDVFETWRISRGLARFPVDLDGDSLPAEAGLDEPPIIDRTKGCYLGQESVAKVRNFGHPTRVIIPVAAEGPVAAGEVALADGIEVGLVTSTTGSEAIARIRWNARDAELRTPDGRVLRRG